MLSFKINNLIKLLIPAMAVTSTLSFAKDDGAESDVREEELSSIRYSKEELAAAAHPNFIKTRDLSNVLSEKISLLATTLTQRQGGSNTKLYEMAGARSQPTREQHMKRLGTLVYDPNTTMAETDREAIRLQLGAQSRKSVEVKFKEAVPLIEEIRKGFNFKFSMDRKKPAPTTTASTGPEIRYGLVVADIQPADAPAIASLGTSGDMGLEYATRARVVYTIDRIDNQPTNRRVFPEAAPAAPSNEASFTSAPTTPAVWKRPSTDIDVKVEAANTDDTISDKVTGGVIPGGKVTFSQADGLFATQVVTNSHLGKDSIAHEVKLPIFGEASLARKMDEHFRPSQTSVYNLLVKKDAPIVNIHYLNSDDRFKGELFIKRNNYDLGLVAEPRSGWGPKSKVGQVGDKISVTLAQSF